MVPIVAPPMAAAPAQGPTGPCSPRWHRLTCWRAYAPLLFHVIFRIYVLPAARVNARHVVTCSCFIPGVAPARFLVPRCDFVPVVPVHLIYHQAFIISCPDTLSFTGHVALWCMSPLFLGLLCWVCGAVYCVVVPLRACCVSMWYPPLRCSAGVPVYWPRRLCSCYPCRVQIPPAARFGSGACPDTSSAARFALRCKAAVSTCGRIAG